MDIIARHIILMIVACSLLVAAESDAEFITVEGLPESIRNQLPRTIGNGIVVDVRVDHRNGDIQYLLRYRGQATNDVQTMRMSQNGKIVDDNVIGVQDSKDVKIGIPADNVLKTEPSAPNVKSTPAVAPLRSQDQDQKSEPKGEESKLLR